MQMWNNRTNCSECNRSGGGSATAPAGTRYLQSQWRPALFNLDAGELDHLRPFFGGFRNDRPEFRRRAPEHCAAELDDPGFDLGIGEAGIELLVQETDDFGRSISGDANARKAACLVTGHE